MKNKCICGGRWNLRGNEFYCEKCNDYKRKAKNSEIQRHQKAIQKRLEKIKGLVQESKEMKCEKCKINDYEVRKNGKPKFTLIWDSQVSDMKRFCFCKPCRLDYEKRNKETRKRNEELRKAPLEIMKKLLMMKAGEEWNLKLSDAEYFIKCVK